MNTSAATADTFWSDRINPILLKEMRQAVNGHFLSTILLIFLGFSVLMLGIFLMSASSTNSTLGQKTFIYFCVLLGLTCLVFPPLYGIVRLWLERGHQHMDLMYITGLQPPQIVMGKWLTTMMLTLLIYSASLPFLTVTYFLRGIDIPTILLTLFTGIGNLCVINMGAVFVGILTSRWVIRIFLLFPWLFFTFLFFFVAMAAPFAWRGLIFQSPHTPALLGMWPALVHLGTTTFYVLSVARVQSASFSRFPPIGRWTGILFLGSLGMLTVCCWITETLVWLFIGLFVVSTAVVFMCCGIHVWLRKNDSGTSQRSAIPVTPSPPDSHG